MSLMIRSVRQSIHLSIDPSRNQSDGPHPAFHLFRRQSICPSFSISGHSRPPNITSVSIRRGMSLLTELRNENRSTVIVLLFLSSTTSTGMDSQMGGRIEYQMVSRWTDGQSCVADLRPARMAYCHQLMRCRGPRKCVINPTTRGIDDAFSSSSFYQK